MLDVTLPIELTNGNDGRGNRWFSSAKVRKKIEQQLRALGLQRTPFELPVRVFVTRILGKGQRLWDSSSIGRGNWKEIEDALVAVGWFFDDGPKWIVETRFSQDDSQRENGPAIRVQVILDRGQTMSTEEGSSSTSLQRVVMRPLFVPLKSQYYEAFLDGSKDTEYRKYGKGWNERTCVVGRRVTISKGYGKQHRRTGTIVGFETREMSSEAWIDCYGEPGLAACIKIELDA